MTGNRLIERRDRVEAPPAMSAQQWCDMRNSNMPRDDIEWFVTPDGQTALRDRADWQAKRTKEMAIAAESERRQFNHRTRYPATATQEAAE